MIDFSKAPEGAKAYVKGSDVIKCAIVISGVIKEETLWVNDCNEFTWGACLKWFPISLLKLAVQPIEIPKQNKMLIECKTEREVMLCEQVLRMCRGEESEMRRYSGWYSLGGDTICIGNDYRAKPKKELIVPWEFIPDCFDVVIVEKSGCVYVEHKESQTRERLWLKLDLTDIDLPVTVKRPMEK